jgi:amino acid adenylation domain-containing protein/non-ribosomal peptide synthase protein (TIGR01720 family)
VFRLEGAVDVEALEASFGAIVERHEILRTVMREEDGIGHQMVLPADQWQLQKINIQHTDDQSTDLLIRRLIGIPFDLSKDFMLKAWMIEVSPAEHILLTLFHHIAFDGWSIKIMVEELSALYNNKTAQLRELSIQYSDYAVWQRTHLSGELLQTKLNYWKTKLQHTEPLELPTDLARPLVQSMSGKIAGATLSKELTDRLNTLSREEGATLFMTLLSAFNILIYKYTYHSDICIGTPIAGRQQQEVEGLIGFFVNTLALRNELVKEQTFRQVLQAVKQTTLEAYEHQEVPFEKIVEALGVERDLSRTPVFQVMFTLENMPEAAPLHLGSAVLTEQNTGVVNAKFDLGLTISASEQGLGLEMTYCSDLFYDDTITRMLAHYQQVLELLVGHTDETIGQFTIATREEERQLLHEFSNYSAGHEPCGFSLQDEMDRQLAANGNDIAIYYKDRSVSYTQLQAFIDKVCGCLRNGYGFNKGQRIVLLLNRSEKLVMSVLALLRSGLVYIPIDATYPEERILYMINDAQPALVIAEDEWMDVLAPHGIKCTGLDTLLDYRYEGRFCEKTAAGDEAYIIYTSGSTGMPKGVIVTHGNLDHLFQYIHKEYCNSGKESMPFVASHAFDISLLQLYAPLLSGGSVRVVDQDQLKDIEQLVSILQKTTVIDTVPGLYKLILRHIEEHRLVSGFAHIRRAFVGGDLIPDDLLHKMSEIFSNADIVISYGPTEGTVFCTQYIYAPGAITPSTKGSVIGRPLNRAEVYVLGPSLELLPTQVEGEICIGGPGVSKGYLNQREQTENKYVANPYKPGERIYRTGDVGQWSSSGILEFRGRNDNQVKIRGNRIELGELENRMKALDAVKEAIVVVVRKPNMDASLSAFYTGTETGRDVLEAHLARFFSESVLPSQYIHINTVPLTANGKVDRKALQQAANDSVSNNKKYEAPRNETEETLAIVWQKLLGADRAGIHDNFFELGGDSIITIQAVSRLKQKGYALHPKDIFQHQTIARLSALLARRGLSAAIEKGEQGNLQGTSGLLPVQQWYFENATGAISHFNQSALLALDKKIAQDGLGRALQLLIEQHDALRFQYTFNNGVWTQEYGNKIPALIVEETGASGASLAEAIEKLADNYQSGLDIAKGELVKAVLIKTPAQEKHNRLLIIVHHLAMDGVSWRILLHDMELLLDQEQQGVELSLGTKGTSYRQWYDTLAHYSRSRQLLEQRQYWGNIAGQFIPLPNDANEIAATDPARETYITHLSISDSELLLQQVPKAYHTEINDLLLAALAQALGNWSGNEHIVIGLEGHGREDMADTDLSRTIGWFTSVFPAAFNLEGIASEDDLIRSVKEQIRAIPGKGLGYGILKYFNKEASLQGRQPWEIVFNYLGQAANIVSGQWISAAHEPTGNNIAVTLPADNKMEIVSLVQDGALEIKWNYDTRHYHATTIECLAINYIAHLEKLVHHCVAQLAKGSVYTPSDYGFAGEIGYKDLDAFTKALPDSSSIESIYRLSSLQQGMLFHGLYDHSSGSYIEQFCAGLTDVDLDAFSASWQQIMKRHSVLRSGFYSDAFSIPVQCVYSNAKLPVEVLDYRSLPDQEEAIRLFEQADRAKGFDFRTPPLMRVTLLQLQEKRYRMVWTFHHILFDGWSMPVLMEEFLQAYEELLQGEALTDKTVPPAEDRYEDYIRYIERRDRDKEESYWTNYLKLLERGSLLPFISNVTERTKGKGIYDEEMLVLDEETTARIQAYARDHRLTVNTIMQGVWAYLLYRYTGNNDVVYGATVSGRPDDLPGVEKSVGLYINTLPLYAQVAEDQPVPDWLHAIQQSQLASREYQYSSLTDIQDWSGVKGELFDTILVFENYPVAKVIAAHPWKLQVENLQAKGSTNYPLGIIIETADKITACFKYNTSVLDSVYVRNICSHFRQALLQMIDDNTRTIGAIDMLAQKDKGQLLQEFSRSTAAYPEHATMIGLFEEQVALHPDTIAIVSAGGQLTYRQLNERSNQLAHHLQSIGIKERSLVPLCMDKPLQMIVAILGILKAGAAYVPLDPGSPRARLEHMMEEAGTGVVLTTRGCSHLAHRDKIKYVVELDGDDAAILQQSKARPVCSITPEDPLYVIYTSGSTGSPKGVMIRHCSIVDYVFGLKEKIRVDECRSFALVSAIFTDLGNTVIYSSLLLGGTLHVFDMATTSDPESMCRYFEEHPIDCLKIVPSHFKALCVEERMPLPLKWLVFGGEALQAEMVEKITAVAKCRIANHYGPTETTIGKLLHVVQPSAAYQQTIPIGRPFSNTHIYVLSAARQLCPIGVPGELYIGGTGVAAGYVDNEELTALKFISDPFSEANGVMYRTGDLVKYLPDGNVSFIGRADNQVKIRGYRVELGEIESVLQQAPGITNAVVVMQADERANSRLIAFVTARDMDKETVLFYLRDRLPDYMIPAAILQVDAMPLTSNGKVDRKRLPMADLSALLSDKYAAPRNEMEEALVDIWQELLGAGRIGIHDNFFELGGNSLLIMRMDGYIKKRLKIAVPITILFRLATIDEISKHLEVELREVQEEAEFDTLTI